MDGPTITVPRPAPDQVLLAAVAEDGAICWTLASKALAADGDLLAQLIPVLAEGQAELRLAHDRHGG